MRKFLNKILVFTLVTVIFISLLQLIFSLSTKNKSIAGHDNLEYTSNINAEIVLLGSSRCLSHFDPKFFLSEYNLKTVNLGVEGHSELAMIQMRLVDYLSRNLKPKFAILSFDPLIHAGTQENNVNFTNKNAFARYAFFPDKQQKVFVDYFKFNFRERYIPLYAAFKYRIFFKGISFQKDIGYLKTGHTIKAVLWDTIARPVNLSLRKNFISTSDFDSVKLALNNLNELCKEEGIKLICIQTPVYKTFQKDQAFSLPKQICDVLDIPFIDVNMPEIGEDAKNFANSYHLNRKGVDFMNDFLSRDSILNRVLRQK